MFWDTVILLERPAMHLPQQNKGILSGMYQAYGGSGIEQNCVPFVGRFSSNSTALSCTAHQVCPKGKYQC